MSQKENTPSTIGISRMVKITFGHRDKLAKLLNNTLLTLQDYKEEFERHLRDKDHEGLGVLIHTSTMTLYYIEASRLDHLMRECRELLLENTGSEALEHATSATIAEFDSVMANVNDIDLDQALKEYSQKHP